MAPSEGTLKLCLVVLMVVTGSCPGDSLATGTELPPKNATGLLAAFLDSLSDLGAYNLRVVSERGFKPGREYVKVPDGTIGHFICLEQMQMFVFVFTNQISVHLEKHPIGDSVTNSAWLLR